MKLWFQDYPNENSTPHIIVDALQRLWFVDLYDPNSLRDAKRKTLMKKAEPFFTLGQLSMVLGLLGFMANTFLYDHLPVISFFTGLFLGLSLVMNLACFLRRKSDSTI